MDISTVIAQILGIFFVVAGIALVGNSKAVTAAIEEAVQNKGILFVWGILALGVGAVIVTLNNAWITGLPLLITVLGWLAVLKGAFIMIFPGAAASLYKSFNKCGIIVFCGIVVFALGLVLLYW
jgi:hypothetical protein